MPKLWEGTEHPRRCEAYVRRTGMQCRQWKMPGHPKYCRYHRGKHSSRRAPDIRKGLRKMIYARHLGEKLCERVEYAADHCTMITLRDELAAARALVCDSFLLYQALEKQADIKGLNEVKKATVLAEAAGIVMGQLKEVTSIAKEAHRIESESLLDMKSLHVVLLQVAQIVEEGLNDLGESGVPDTLLKSVSTKLADTIRNEVRLPKKGEAATTTITPTLIDATVVDMDNTIPAED